MQELTLSSGLVIQRYADFQSHYAEARNVDVWQPPAAPAARYPVIYMHDGQNLFEPAWSSHTGVSWGVAEALLRLQREQNLPGALLVGVWHPPQRWCEYMPQKTIAAPEVPADILQQFLEKAGGPAVSDGYLKFLVEELKPFIDATYPTLPDPAHTFVMGSSMGGLVSLYALTEYPRVFGGAGCLSTHWSAGENYLVDALGAALPPAGAHKLYFDYGTEGLDAAYEPFQQRLDGLLEAKGYIRSKDWVTLKFEGADHSENDWRARVHLPLQFLLG